MRRAWREKDVSLRVNHDCVVIGGEGFFGSAREGMGVEARSGRARLSLVRPEGAAFGVEVGQ